MVDIYSDTTTALRRFPGSALEELVSVDFAIKAKDVFKIELVKLENPIGAYQKEHPYKLLIFYKDISMPRGFGVSYGAWLDEQTAHIVYHNLKDLYLREDDNA